MSRLKRVRKSLNSEINVVPYIDVMLVLLVIFMITAPMLSQGVTVDLPKAMSEEIKSSGKEPLILSVDRDGYYYLNVAEQPETPMTAKDVVVQVAAYLELAREAGEKTNVLVKGDQGVAYGKVVYAMGLLKKAGASRVGLMTESSQSEEA